MSGLTCAAILSRLGRKVLVLEQHHDVAGGGTHMFDLKGYRFDSGLHYTVPWSVPLFALTCLKKPRECLPFDLMTEADGTIDKIFLVNRTSENNTPTEPFRMKHHETHLSQLYEMFPEEKEGLDEYMKVSSASMHFVKAFLFSKLLPKWLQNLYWYFVPSSLINATNVTAKELLPRFIKNKYLLSLLSSMWIDTGARPDRASFMLTASVFRGIAMEGGCYPRGGSSEMAKELVTVIEVSHLKQYYREKYVKNLFMIE
jgi:all-trans-retinol 13,14-reductase